jgi:Family of unknown function (DUF5343)
MEYKIAYTDSTTKHLPGAHEMVEGDGGQVQVSPPYISFQSLKTFLASMKEHGVPSRIDRSVLTNFSGAVGKQIITALRFLELINADNVPEGRLHDLVAVYGTDTWKPELARIIRDAYRPIFAIDLENATPALFNEHFKKTYNGADAVVRKCMTFFLNAVREAEVPISNRILSGTKPRSGPAKRRTPKSAVKKARKAGKRQDPGSAEDEPISKVPSQVLFENFDTANMDEEVQNAVWTLIRYFKSKHL